MKRREFFKLSAHKVVELTSEVVKAKAGLRTETWLRPPFSVPEDEFLSLCTRREACIVDPKAIDVRVPEYGNLPADANISG